MVDFRAECERRQQHQKGGDEDENKSRGTRGEQNSFLAKEERRLVGINARGNKFHPLGRDGDGKTTEATGSCSLKPSESREAEVHFSAKHLGEHTLKCTAEYVDCPYDERSAVAIMNVAGENTVYDVGERGSVAVVIFHST